MTANVSLLLAHHDMAAAQETLRAIEAMPEQTPAVRISLEKARKRVARTAHASPSAP